MGLFSRKKSEPPVTPEIRPVHVPIEFAVNKNARKEVIENAKKAQATVDKLLEDNHFTIKIVVLAGAGNKPARNKKG